MRMQSLLIVLLFVVYVACQTCSVTQMPLATNKPGYCSSIWRSGLSRPRGIISLPNNHIILIEATPGNITLLYEDASGVVQKRTLAQRSGLNHGIAYAGGYLYASTASTVFRWPYTVGSTSPLGTPQTVVTGIPSSGHTTRTLIFSPSNSNVLYVSVGSGPNVDTDPNRSGVYSFNMASTLPRTYAQRTNVGRGLRNEVGLRFSGTTLWGVENGADNLNRADLGGDIHNDNPGEEINAIAGGVSYGYPYCWSQYNLPSVPNPRGTQWYWPGLGYTDAQCRNVSINKPPAYLLPAHTAPLDIIFKTSQNFPGIDSGDALVSQHGSWNRSPAIGYMVSHVGFSGGVPVNDTFLLKYQGPGATGTGWHRPVSLAWGKVKGADALMVTSDTTGVIIAITSNTACTCNP